MTKPYEMPWETGTRYDGEINNNEFAMVPMHQARALWEGARMMIEGIDCIVPANRDDKKGCEQAEFLQKAIALLKKGIGE